MDGKFIMWLHKLSLFGYEKKVIIPSSMEGVVKELYEKGTPPKKAMDEIIKKHKDKLISTT